MLEHAIYRFFYWMLKHGMGGLVYRLSGMYLGGHCKSLYGAQWEIQAELMKLGYLECPSCLWATTGKDHEYCLEQLQSEK
jgi:hypothetical protein